ncbi:MAG: hypothetical protein LBH43_09740 [Treponema sp.]|jgi:hypothetical protein|nr:hypothetical protein [Treponema sp.]
MKFLKILPVLLVLSACTTAPSLKSYFVDAGVIQFFLSPTEWRVKDSRMYAKLDITYRTGTDTPVAVNISFFGEKAPPSKITFLSLNGNDIDYPLNTITVLYHDIEKREVRISSKGDHDNLPTLLEAEPISLTAEIDGAGYTFIPDKRFIELKNNFLVTISYY